MEQALTRISPETSTQEFKENPNIPVRDSNGKNNFNPIKPAEVTHSNAPIQKPKFSNLKLEENPQKHGNIPISKSEPFPQAAKDSTETNVLLGGLEAKCVLLESSLKQLEQKYETQRKEKESLTV